MTANEVLVIVGMALAVFVPKVLPLVIVSESLTTRLRPWLVYVAPAVLGALVAPSLLAPSLVAPGWDQAGFGVAFLVALRTRRMLPALAAGLVVVALVTIFHVT
jgi:branched-subunit amino acid transport protein